MIQRKIPMESENKLTTDYFNCGLVDVGVIITRLEELNEGKDRYDSPFKQQKPRNRKKES